MIFAISRGSRRTGRPRWWAIVRRVMVGHLIPRYFADCAPHPPASMQVKHSAHTSILRDYADHGLLRPARGRITVLERSGRPPGRLREGPQGRRRTGTGRHGGNQPVPARWSPCTSPEGGPLARMSGSPPTARCAPEASREVARGREVNTLVEAGTWRHHEAGAHRPHATSPLKSGTGQRDARVPADGRSDAAGRCRLQTSVSVTSL